MIELSPNAGLEERSCSEPAVLQSNDHDLRDLLLTTTEAALLVHTTTTVVSKWRERGKLPIAARTADGRPLYHPRDVVNVERATRQNTQRRGGPKRAVRVAEDAA